MVGMGRNLEADFTIACEANKQIECEGFINVSVSFKLFINIAFDTGLMQGSLSECPASMCWTTPGSRPMSVWAS